MSTWTWSRKEVCRDLFARNKFMRFTLFNWNKIQFSHTLRTPNSKFMRHERHERPTYGFISFRNSIESRKRYEKKIELKCEQKHIDVTQFKWFRVVCIFAQTHGAEGRGKTKKESDKRHAHRRPRRRRKNWFARSRFILNRMTDKTDFLLSHSNSTFIEFKSNPRKMWMPTGDRPNPY